MEQGALAKAAGKRTGLRLNVGCGLTRPEGWINLDSSLNSFLQGLPLVGRVARTGVRSTRYVEGARYLDLRSRWPFADGSASIVYASHVVEHLSVSQAAHFFRESRRVLAAGGVIRIVVPDLEALAKLYLQELAAGASGAAGRFLEAMNLHLEGVYPPRANLAAKAVATLQGHPHQHKYMYDVQTMRSLFEANGFKGAIECTYGQSRLIDCIEDVEHTKEGMPSIYLESSS